MITVITEGFRKEPCMKGLSAMVAATRGRHGSKEKFDDLQLRHVGSRLPPQCPSQKVGRHLCTRPGGKASMAHCHSLIIYPSPATVPGNT